jgi:hypothetical protein
MCQRERDPLASMPQMGIERTAQDLGKLMRLLVCR